MKNVILYVRVSTDEQADRGFSLRDQEEKLLTYCKDNDREVLMVFREDYSAKTFNRPEFNKLLKYAKQHHKIIDELLVIKWDRFSRNTSESYQMIDRFNALQIRTNAITQPLDMSIPEQGIMMAVYLSVPEVENQRRSQNVTAGMRRALKEGRYVGSPPKGYSVGRDSSKKPILQPNHEAHFIQEAYEMYSEGVYNQREIIKHLAKKGFKTSKTVFAKIIRNPLYYGKVFIKAHKEEPEQLVEGIHEPLISEQLYNKVQAILNKGKGAKNTNYKRLNPNFPLRGFINCPKCQKTLTASTSRSRKNYYSYYHCISPCDTRISAEDAHAWFNSFLKSVSLDNNSYTLLLEIIKEEFKKIDATNPLGPKHYEKLTNLKDKLTRMQDLFIDGELSKKEYEQAKQRCQVLIEELEEKEIKLGKKKEIFDTFKKGLTKIQTIEKQYSTGSLDQKRKLVGSIFPQKFEFENKKIRTADLNPILLKISSVHGGLQRSKRKGQTKKHDLSSMVTAKGFEPGTYSLEVSCSIQLSYAT
jgi:site-specific DNA recombinase